MNHNSSSNYSYLRSPPPACHQPMMSNSIFRPSPRQQYQDRCYRSEHMNRDYSVDGSHSMSNQNSIYSPYSEDYYHSPPPRPKPMVENYYLVPEEAPYQVSFDCEETASRPGTVVEPPSWSVPARGESRLQPIGETSYTHPPVDLTTRRWFHVGRSPSSDIPLLHSTSSRRHALIFHHQSGACYITDCNSVHGTYVDGNRVLSYPNPPRKVRRGAMIRFGGPGAPTYILKSFAVSLKDLVQNLGGVANLAHEKQQKSVVKSPRKDDEELASSSKQETATPEDEDQTQPEQERQQSTSLIKITDYVQESHQWLRRRGRNTVVCNLQKEMQAEAEAKKKNPQQAYDVLTCIRGDGGGVACMADGRDAPRAALVLLNTRLNAVGRRGLDSSSKQQMTAEAQKRFWSLSRTVSQEELPEPTPTVAVTTPELDEENKNGKRKRDGGIDNFESYQSSRSNKRYKPILRSPLPKKNSEDDCSYRSRILHHIQDRCAEHYSPCTTLLPPPLPSLKERTRRVKFADEDFDRYSIYSVPEVSFDDAEPLQQQQTACVGLSRACNCIACRRAVWCPPR